MRHGSKEHQPPHERQLAMGELSSLLFEQTLDAIVVINMQGHCTAVNQHACTLLGYPRQELLTLTWWDVILTDDPPGTVRPAELPIAAVPLSRCQMRSKDGRVLEVEIRTHRLTDAHLLVFISNITEQKHVEKIWQERTALEERLTKIVANAPGAICSFRVRPDGSAHFPYVSSAIVDICGLRPEDLEDDASPYLQRVHPDDLERLTNAVVQSAHDLAPLRVDYRMRHPTKGEIWIEGFWTPEREPDGGLLWQGFIQDSTTRKQTEEQLRYQANVLQYVSDAIITTDLDFVITGWNHAAEAIYGWSASEIIGQKIGAILPPQYIDDQSEQVLRVFSEHGYWQGEVIHNRKDGTPVTVMSSVSVVKDQSGNQMGTVGVNRDISERKQAEEARAKIEAQLHQAQNMESIGRLVGGVAHNFNNMLTVIQGMSELIGTQLPSGSPLREDLQQIRAASDRAVVLTRELLAFGRKQMLDPTTLNLNRQIEQLRMLLKQLINEDITLLTVLQPDLWPVSADSSQIDQVLMSLVINARDAMPTGGILTIETRNISPDDDFVQTQLNVPSAPCVMVAITDTGSGMDVYIQSQVFEPFFTTKAFGQGTGLGLATVYGTIKQSGGNITVESRPGHGTTFRVYLPVSAITTVHVAPSSPQSVALGSHETILLVEDEEHVRYLIKVALRNNGYTVLEAHDGIEAIAVAEQHQAQIDILVTDVVMPHLSGRTLAEQLKVLQPHIKILFTSGYTDDMMIRRDVLADGIAFLPKPFSASTLVAKVRQVLDT